MQDLLCTRRTKEGKIIKDGFHEVERWCCTANTVRLVVPTAGVFLERHRYSKHSLAAAKTNACGLISRGLAADKTYGWRANTDGAQLVL